MCMFISNSEIETMEFAKKLASYLKTGDTIILSGDLGAGKTKFTEGFLSFFHLEDEISSPTFTIVNEYCKNDINVYHFDVYRLSCSDEFYAIGGDEYLEKGICIIEWGEIIEDIIHNDYIKITIEKDLNHEFLRKIIINCKGNRFNSIIDKLKLDKETLN